MPLTLRRPEPSEHNPRYARYMDLVPETDLPEAMLRQLDETRAFLGSIPEPLHDHRYAPDKWTFREVVGHIMDTERIFGFRLLTFARGDSIALERADEKVYVANAEFNRCALSTLVEEFTLLRRANAMLLRQLPQAAWDRTGVVSGSTITVRAIGYLMLGHERHHLDVLRTRYL